MDLATVFAALGLDPDDPEAADDVAVVRALVARRSGRTRGGVVTGPQIRRATDRCRANGPEVRWRP